MRQLLLFCLLCLQSLTMPTFALEVGDRLQGFRLQDTQGYLHTAETHAGHVLILYFFGHD